MHSSDSLPVVYVFAVDPSCQSRAEQLAEQLKLPVRNPDEVNDRGFSVQKHEFQEDGDNIWYLSVSTDGLAIQQFGPGAAGAVRVDFVAGKMGFRRQRQEATPDLVKAVGLRPGVRPTVWDLTAGLGQDAFTLARYGCELVLFERHPLVYALLADGLERARGAALAGDEGLLDIVERMTLIPADSHQVLKGDVEQGSVPDAQVIYIDSMFPERSKSAKVKKEMQLFQQLVGADLDADALIHLALARQPHRIVVKRPRHAPALGNVAPTLDFKGKAVRYDVYAMRRIEP